MSEDDIRNQFIIQEDVGRLNAESLARRALRFGRITKDGHVIIENQNLSKGDQLKLALLIRYIGNQLDESIRRSVRPSELTQTLGQRLEAIGSLLSKLAFEGFAKKEGPGEYSIFPYKIEVFLSHLESPEQNDSDSSHRKYARTRSSATRTRGVGADIQRLIDEGFFEKPIFVSEVSQKLKAENFHHDDRVIDTTLRKTFVSSKRILKRIPNEGPGKAKWLYVIRK